MIRLIANIIRNDFEGLGHYNAPRGGRFHNGIDLLCLPGLLIFADETLEFIRIAKPYKKESDLTGGLWRNKKGDELKIFYAEPVTSKKLFHKGDVMAVCQDVTKDNKLMMPHIHVEIYKNGERIDPEKVLDFKGNTKN